MCRSTWLTCWSIVLTDWLCSILHGSGKVIINQCTRLLPFIKLLTQVIVYWFVPWYDCVIWLIDRLEWMIDWLIVDWCTVWKLLSWYWTPKEPRRFTSVRNPVWKWMERCHKQLNSDSQVTKTTCIRRCTKRDKFFWDQWLLKWLLKIFT